MNSISISGNIGKDCEIRQLPNGDSVAQFSVADSQGKDKPTIWWRASLFGKRADSLSPYLLKGQQVTVIGQVTEREYTKDGETKKAMEIRVTDVALQGKSANQSDSQPAQRPAAPRPAARPPAPAQSSGFDADFGDDSIPF